jgi:epimerase transport system membrane fusion protein
MPKRDDIITDERPYARLGLFTLLLAFVIPLAWASLAPLNSAVVASGRISVASDNKVVQHLDGGLVEQIAVKDGDLVEAGQLLLVLDSESLNIRLDQVDDRLLEIRANLERLTAERNGKDELAFSAELQAQAESELGQEILRTQQQLFSSRRSAHQAEQNMLEQRLAQTRKQIEGSVSLIGTQSHRLKLLRKEHKTLQKLAQTKVVSDTKVREVEGAMVGVQGELVAQEGEQARLRESLAETRFSATLRQQEYHKEVVTQLRDLQAQQIDLQSERRKTLDRLSRIDVRAPVAGKVKGFKVVTLGAVISAGQSIMEIVPRERMFRIDARVSPMDIDSLHPGLKAEVRIPVFESAQRFPSLFADLLDVSTDVYQDEYADEAYYKASLRMDESSLDILSNEQLNLVSGMPAEVVIKTGERTLTSYLLQPISDMLARAFNEN